MHSKPTSPGRKAGSTAWRTDRATGDEVGPGPEPCKERDGGPSNPPGGPADSAALCPVTKKRRRSIDPPDLPDTLARWRRREVLAQEREFVEVEVVDLDLSGDQAQGLVMTSCRAKNLAFVGTDLRGVRLTDVELSGSDFSGADLSEAELTRVVIKGCRISGARFSMAHLKDVQFLDCKMEGVNLRMAEGERVRIRHSNLREADFYAVRLETSLLVDSDLSDADFSKADLRGCALQGSTIDRIKGAGDLGEISIDSAQAVLFSEMLLELHKITVADTRPEEELA
jgi:uncharacterized protein YjbI with pentapeptide repeats